MNRFAGVASLVLVLGLVAPVTTTPAQGLDISVDASVDVLSGYVWRGFVVGADDKLAIQPSLTLGFGDTGFSLNLWGSAFAMDRGAPVSLDQVDELDFTVDYTMSVNDQVDVSLGFIEYTFPSLNAGTKHTEEVYGAVAAGGFLSPSLTVYYDFGQFDAAYITAGVGPELPLNKDGSVSLALSGSVGAFLSNGVAGNHFGDITISAGVGFPAGAFTITPVAGFTYADDKVNIDNTAFWGGVSFGWSK